MGRTTAEPQSEQSVFRRMRMHLVINDRAGTVVGADVRTVADRVALILAAAGHQVETEIVEPEQFDNSIKRILAMNPDALIVGGGDGTIRSAATVMIGSRPALGVLPLGTINRLARDLKIPLDYEAAARALATARIQDIDVAEVNGRLFLCNAILGLTTRFSITRQRLRGKAFQERLSGYTTAMRELLRSRRRIRIRVSGGARALRLRVLSLAVTNNAYADEPSMSMYRPRLDRGTLAVYASKHASGWRMVMAACKALFGRLSGDSDVVQLTSPRLTVDVPRRRSVPLSIDGEIEELSTPLAFSVRPRALKVFVPVEHE